METVQQRKAKLRSVFLEKRRALSAEDVAEKSLKISEQILKSPAFAKAGSAHIYLAKTENLEVDTTAIVQRCLNSHKAVFVPVITSSGQMRHCRLKNLNSLSLGPFGIPQPPLEDLLTDATLQADLVLVPGLAFDRHGFRLGYGHGYYDRFLASRPDWVQTIGLAYDFQMTEELPIEGTDIRLSSIIFA